MTTYKILYIYQVTAESKKDALMKFAKLRQENKEDDHLETVIVKEKEVMGWGAGFRKQVLGK